MNKINRYDVYFYEAFEEESAALRSFLNHQINAGFTWQTIQEAGDVLPPARLISIRTQSIIPVQWAKSLNGVLSRSTGYDHLISYRERTNLNLVCGYLPLYCNRAVAEQALLLWMALLRKLPRQMKQFNNFSRDGLTGHECQGKTLLVVGVGNIGYQVVKIGRGMGMQTFGVDIVRKHDDINYLDIEEGIAAADIIVCAMNLTKKNVGYFDYKLLKKAKSGIIFVNIARGELSPAEDLLRLLRENHLGGIGMDVYEAEGTLATALRKGQPAIDPIVAATLELTKWDNVILTPHNAFNCEESVIRKSEQSIRQIEKFLNSGQFVWNIPDE